MAVGIRWGLAGSRGKSASGCHQWVPGPAISRCTGHPSEDDILPQWLIECVSVHGYAGLHLSSCAHERIAFTIEARRLESRSPADWGVEHRRCDARTFG